MREGTHLCGLPPQNTSPSVIRTKTSDEINPSSGAFYETSELHSSKPYRLSKTRKVTGFLQWAGGQDSAIYPNPDSIPGQGTEIPQASQ